MAEITGIHHLKLPVSDLKRSRDWYERVLGLRVDLEFPDQHGVVRGVAGTVPGLTGRLALREHPAAAGIAGFDPICFAIADRQAADAWVARLDELGVEHGPVVGATTGWMVRFPDPDGTEIRLYSTAKHDTTDRTGQAGFAHRTGDLEGRRFRAAEDVAGGEVEVSTIFTYHEQNGAVWAEYSGGKIRRGYLIGTRNGDRLDFRYSQLNTDGETSSGHCVSTVHVLPGGKLRLEETWEWESRPGSGTSAVVEI